VNAWKPADLADQARAARAIADILWPDGDMDREWEAADLDEIAGELMLAGLGPTFGDS
jgi:hypothetical protein